MAKKLLVKASRLNELHVFFNSISPQEIAEVSPAEPMKAIRGVSKLLDELEEANKPMIELGDAIEEQAKPVKEKFQKLVEKAESENEKQKVLADANKEVGKVLEKAREELKADVLEESEIELVIQSDDRFKLAKEVFDKLAAKKYRKTQPLAEASEAFENAKEV